MAHTLELKMASGETMEWLERVEPILTLPRAQDLPRPSQKVTLAACEVIEAFYWVAKTWEKPLVNSNDEGEIVLEWWQDTRKITVYIGENEVVFLKIWGPNIENEMQDGVLTNAETVSALWNWLHE